MNRLKNAGLYFFMLGAILLLVMGCASSAPSPTPIIRPKVELSETGLTIGDQPFEFIGANTIYYAFYKESGLNIEDAIRSASENGIKVIRIYIWLGNASWGGKPIEEYDKVIALAAKYNIYVIVTLTDCTPGDWGSTKVAYLSYVPQCDLTSDSGLVSFKNQIYSVLFRKNTVTGILYKDDPTILAWDIANELKLDYFSSADFTKWIMQVAPYIKQLDATHLVTIGLQDGAAIFSDGSHPEVFNIPEIDFFSLHFYPGFKPGMVGIEDSDLEILRSQIEMYRAMGKPVVLEEFGVGSQRILPTDADPSVISGWIQAYRQLLDTAFSGSVSGAMFWGWGVAESKEVGYWWNVEDHDVTEIEFCDLIKNYIIP